MLTNDGTSQTKPQIAPLILKAMLQVALLKRIPIRVLDAHRRVGGTKIRPIRSVSAHPRWIIAWGL